MLSLAGRAQAGCSNFCDGDLVRVMYDTNTHFEMATDLGAISALQAAGNWTAPAVALGTGPGQFNAASWGEVNAAYFALGTGAVTPYIASTGTLTPVGTGNGSSLIGNLNALLGFYGMYAAGSNTWSFLYVQNGITITNSYYYVMDGNGNTVGSMGGYLDTLSSGRTEVNNGSLSTQLLFAFANPDSTAAGAASGLTIQTLSGLTTITYSSTTTKPAPIPPSILLLGPGLLVAIGVHRKRVLLAKRGRSDAITPVLCPRTMLRKEEQILFPGDLSQS